MKMISFVSVTCMAILLCVSTTSAQSNGRITITVTNQTTEEPVSDQNVVLLRHINESEQLEKQAEGRTDQSGQYTFTGLAVDGAHYAITALYHGVTYTTEHLSLQAGVEMPSIQLNLYEVTSAMTFVQIETHHMVVEVNPGIVNVTEIIVLHNTGNETVTPFDGQQQGLRLSVPAHTTQITPMSAGLETNLQGLLYTNPLLPGKVQVIYSYTLNQESSGDVLSKTVDYDTGQIQVMIVPDTQEATGMNLTNEGVRQIGDRIFLVLSNLSGLSRDMTFNVQLEHAILWQDVISKGVLGLVALMVVIGVVVFIRIDPAQTSDTGNSTVLPAYQAEELEQIDQPLDHIFHTIAALDDQYDAGDIDGKIYHRRRKKLKNRATRLIIREETYERTNES